MDEYLGFSRHPGTPTTDGIPDPDPDPRPPVTPGPDDFTDHYFGPIACSAIMVITLLLAIPAVSLNLGVIAFYRRNLQSIVPFIYFILAASDLCTGVCSGLHSVVFLIFLVVQSADSLMLYWIAVPAYFITIVSFRLSAFVSMVFSLIRTINIVSPFTRVNKRAVMVSILIYTALWGAIFLTEVVIMIDVSEKPSSIFFMRTTFYEPGYLKSIITRTYSYREIDHKDQCLFGMFSTVLPVSVASLIALLTGGLQIFYLLRPTDLDTEMMVVDKEKKRVGITIAMITLLFFVCSSFNLFQPVGWCFPSHGITELSRSAKHTYMLAYLFGYLPMFVNAALNPVILVLRGEKVNRYIRGKLGLPQLRSSSTVSENKAAGLTQCSRIDETAA